MSLECECVNWCRDGISQYPHLRGVDLPAVVTNHHRYCPHYNDSLIDVWKVTYEGQSFYTDREPTADELENGETVTKEKMHREVYKQLPEFEGF